MSIDPKVVEKVRKLLAQAEGTDNQAEAEAFSAKAAELIDQYRIDAEVLRPAGTGPVYGRTTYHLAGHKYLRASLALLVGVAKHYGVLILVPLTGNSKRPTLVGTAEDIQAVELMFTSLVIQRDHALLSERVPGWENPTRFRNSFAYGYAVRISARLTALRDRQAAVAQTEGNSTALALFDRQAAVTRWVEQTTGAAVNNRNTNSPRLTADGIAAGDEAARRADLGQTRVGSSGPRAIGA